MKYLTIVHNPIHRSVDFFNCIDEVLTEISYVWFQMRTHHGFIDAVLEMDEEKDEDRHRDLAKNKLTFVECIVALLIALACVSLHAIFLGKLSELSIIINHSFTSILCST